MNEVEGIHAAGRDDDLIGAAGNAAPFEEVAGDGMAQRRPAKTVAMFEKSNRRVAPDAAQELAPFIVREMLPIDEALAERPRWLALVRVAAPAMIGLRGGVVVRSASGNSAATRVPEPERVSR